MARLLGGIIIGVINDLGFVSLKPAFCQKFPSCFLGERPENSLYLTFVSIPV